MTFIEWDYGNIEISQRQYDEVFALPFDELRQVACSSTPLKPSLAVRIYVFDDIPVCDITRNGDKYFVRVLVPGAMPAVAASFRRANEEKLQKESSATLRRLILDHWHKARS